MCLGAGGHISCIRAQIPVENSSIDFRLGAEEQICACTPKGMIK
jgi:hypothetical protein